MPDVQKDTKPASTPSSPITPTMPSSTTKKSWMDMSKVERDADKATKLSSAIIAVKKGAKSGVQFKIGEFTLTARPSGVTDKGNVSYNFPSQVIPYEGDQLRINKFSVTIMKAGTAEDPQGIDWDTLSAPTTQG